VGKHSFYLPIKPNKKMKVEVILNDVQAVCSKEQWAAADQAEHRDFFVAGKTYGGAGDKEGKWEARKIAFRNKETNQIVNVVWAVCYCIDDKTRGALTKSFLLSEGRCEANGDVLTARGDVRQWADENIVDGVLKSEWTAALAAILNDRGLIMEKEKYQQAKTAGGTFVAAYMQPYFADTYTAE
jgi:hypothetical protein